MSEVRLEVLDVLDAIIIALSLGITERRGPQIHETASVALLGRFLNGLSRGPMFIGSRMKGSCEESLYRVWWCQHCQSFALGYGSEAENFAMFPRIKVHPD